MDETSNAIPNPYINSTPNSPVTLQVATPPSNGTSQNTRTIVTVLLLIFVYPVGFFVMWFWSKWKVWVKILVSFLLTIGTMSILAPILLIAINPVAQIEKAKQMETGGNSYKEAFRTSYMGSCATTSGNKKAYCECTFKYLEDAGLDFQDTSKVISSLPAAIQSCKSMIQ